MKLIKVDDRVSFGIPFFLLILIMLVGILFINHQEVIPAVSSEKFEWQEILDSIFQIRDSTLLSGNADELKKIYVSGEKNARYAVELELQRAKYLNDWSARQCV